jgi:hypothetical protein
MVAFEGSSLPVVDVWLIFVLIRQDVEPECNHDGPGQDWSDFLIIGFEGERENPATKCDEHHGDNFEHGEAG